METRYFNCKEKRNNEKTEPWQEVKLNKDNQWYIQLARSINTAFSMYNISNPPAVYVYDRIQWGDEPFMIDIYILRPELHTPEDFNHWMEVECYIQDELDHLAKDNSDEERTIYEFFII